MKRFTVPCDFNGVKHPFHVYIGEPHPKKHPLQFQAWWLSSERGGTIPQDVMDSFEKLFKIAQENNVSFEDLCVYALGTASEEEGGDGAVAAPTETPPTEAAPAEPAPVEEPVDEFDPMSANPVPPPPADEPVTISDEYENDAFSADIPPPKDPEG